MRRADRAVTDREKILQILDACHCCRVGFSDPDGAYIVPLSFAFVPGTPDRFYFHGAKEGRKAARIAARPKAGFELDCSYALVEGTSGCSYSCRYQSVIGTGRIGEVTDMEEKKQALAAIMAPGRGGADLQGTKLRRKRMNDFELQHLPEAYRPLSPWTYFGLGILYSLPLVGWIFLIVHAVGSQNLNRRNYARSYFCLYVLAIILIAVLGAMGVLSDLGDVARGTFA